MYKLTQANEINNAISQLPIAREVEICKVGDNDALKQFKGIEVQGQIVSIPSSRYKLVQHEQAFRPIVEGLVVAGVKDFEFCMWSNKRKAELNVFVGRGFDTVRYGFSIMNSFDKTTSIRYGFSSFMKRNVIEVVGYRQICSNGMKIRVPLDQAEFVRVEEREKIEQLLKESCRILHFNSAEQKIEKMQYVVEAMIYLEKPIQRIIERAKKWNIENEDEAKKLIKKYVGKRMLDKIYERLGHEEMTLWGLYNSITYLASHEGYKDTTSRSLINKGANLLEKELIVPSQ